MPWLEGHRGFDLQDRRFYLNPDIFPPHGSAHKKRKPAACVFYAILSSWMRLGIHFPDAVVRQVRIYLCRRNIGMTQHFLNTP